MIADQPGTAARSLPFADPTDRDAPSHMSAGQAYGWSCGYARAKADIRKALVEACTHGNWTADRCLLPGCVIARRLDGLE